MDKELRTVDYVLKRLARYAVAAGLIVLAYFTRSSISAALTPVLTALVISFLLQPLTNLLTRKLHFRRWVAIACIMLVLILLIGVLLAFAVPALLNGLNQLIDTLPSIIDGISAKLEQIQNSLIAAGIPNNLGENVSTALEKLPGIIGDAVAGAVTAASDTISFIGMLVIALYFVVFFLKDRKQLTHDLFQLVPAKYRDDVLNTGRNISRSLKKFIKAQALIALISLVATTVGYFIVGLNYALVLGLLMGVFSLVPYIGPIIGAVPALLVSLLQPNVMLGTFIAIVVVQLAIGVVGPKIMGNGLGIHPVYILTGITFFSSLMGIVGMLFALPFVIILKEILGYFVQRKTRREAQEEQERRAGTCEKKTE